MKSNVKKFMWTPFVVAFFFCRVNLLSFRALNSIYSRITFLVAMCAVPGCA